MFHLKALALKMGTISTMNELTSAMEETSKAITSASAHLNTDKLNQLTKTLAKEDAKLEMKSEMLNEVMDNIGESMDDPIEQEKLYRQVLEDVGLQIEDSVILPVLFFI